MVACGIFCVSIGCLTHQHVSVLLCNQEEKKRLLRLAQTGRENATIAARKVLAQLYRLGGVDVRAAFRDFDRDNSELLEMYVVFEPPNAGLNFSQLGGWNLAIVFPLIVSLSLC